MAKLSLPGPTLDYSDEGWAEYVKWLDGTYATLRLLWVDEGSAYSMAAVDDGVYRTFSINKADAGAFEATYKTYVPTRGPIEISANIAVPVAPKHKIVDETFRQMGYTFTATAGAESFLDIVVTEALIYLFGGSFWVSGAAMIGDYAEFSVVDKDDVLGLFTTYGLTVGVDVLELTKYVTKHYVPPGQADGYRSKIEPGTVAAVTQGLYMRTGYKSVGVTDIDLIVHYDWYEV